MKKLLLILSLSIASAFAQSYTLPIQWNASGTNAAFKAYISLNGSLFQPIVITSIAASGSGTNWIMGANISGLPLNSTNRVYVTAVDNLLKTESLPTNTLTNFIAFPTQVFNLIIPGPVTISP